MGPVALEDSLRATIRSVLIEGADTLRASARQRVSCERWLQEQLVRAFAKSGFLATPERGWVDVTVEADAEFLLLELKTFPTNYGAAGKPITQFIQSVIADLGKLGPKVDETTLGYVLWLAYPIPSPTPRTWPHHLRKVEATSLTTELLAQIPVGSAGYAHAYLSRA